MQCCLTACMTCHPGRNAQLAVGAPAAEFLGQAPLLALASSGPFRHHKYNITLQGASLVLLITAAQKGGIMISPGDHTAGSCTAGALH
jgi:hypothetical protein